MRGTVSGFSTERNRNPIHYCLVKTIHRTHIASSMRTSRHPALRFALFWTGVLLIILTPFVGAIPGRGGVFVFAGGLALMLQNSHWAKRRFVHTKRRWPRFGHYADMGLRRPSARRRRERDRESRER